MSTAGPPGGTGGEIRTGVAADHDLLSALAGNQAGRDRDVAHRTRRVVSTSLGVMLDQKAGRKRIRSLVLASIVLVVLALGPLAWWAVENVIAAEHLNDPVCQTSLWACIFYPAIVTAVVVAGWARRRS